MTRSVSEAAFRALKGSGARLFNSGPMPDNDSHWEGYTLRQVIAPLGGTPKKIFITLQTVAETTNAVMSGAWIGQKALAASNPDFDGNQVRVTWGGSNSRNLEGAETIVSDEIALAYDPARPLIFSAQFDGFYGGGMVASLVGNLLTFPGSVVGAREWYIASADAATTLATGYTDAGDSIAGIVSIDAVGSSLVARDFIWFTVRSRVDNSPVNDAYWSGIGDITADVIDPETGGTTTRSWFGAGGLISVDDIPLLSTLTVQTVSIKLSQVSDRINDLLRTYDCKQGQVQIFRGLYNVDTRTMVAPAFPRFVGYIDEAPIKTPSENQLGDVTLTCTSHSQELTRANAETRSDANQKLRSATDNFFQDAGVVGEWQHFWGRAQGTVGSNPAPTPH